MDGPARENETLDTALGGRVAVLQPAKGFRFSVDSVLLARFASELPCDHAVELGCGSGVVGLCVLRLGGSSLLTGIDIQASAVDRAARSSEINGFTERTRFLEMDVKAVSGLLPRSMADLVVANPPYRNPSGNRPSSDPDLNISRNEVCADLKDFVKAAAHLLKKAGRFCLVYPAARFPHLFSTLENCGFSPKSMRLVHPRVCEPASLVLVEALKGGGHSFRVRAPLMLHDAQDTGRKYGEEALSLLGADGVPNALRLLP